MSTKSFSANAVNLFVGTTADAQTGSVTILMKTRKFYTDGTPLTTGNSYVVAKAWGLMAVDKGWASNAAGDTLEQMTPNVQGGVSGAENPVSVSGTPGVGNVLAAVLATGWTATGYQWLRNGVAIAGQTASTYTQVTADRGKSLTVSVTGLAYKGMSITVPGAAAYVGHLTNSTRAPKIQIPGQTQSLCRWAETVRSTPLGDIRIAYPTAFFPSNVAGIESAAGGTSTITSYVCWGATSSGGALVGGTELVAVTWNGIATTVLPDGTIAYLSDPIPGSSVLRPGDVLWGQVAFTNANGIIHETGSAGAESLDTTRGEIYRYAASGLNQAQVSSKGVWTGGTNSTGLRYAPTLVVASTTDVAVLQFGTSIAAAFGSSAKGTPNAPAAAGEIGDRGILARAIGRTTALASVAQDGAALLDLLTPANRAIRMTMLPYFSHVVSDHVTNDIASYNRTETQIVADHTTFSALLGGRPYFISTCGSWVSGAVTLADGSDQTPRTTNGHNTKMPAYNTLLRAGGISGVTGVFDTNSALRLGSDDTKWFANGTASLMTADLLHPTTYAEQRVVSQGVIDTSLFVR